MKTRWWLNIGLLVVLVALGLVIWYQPGTKNKKPKTKITTLAPASIKTIRITQPNQKAAVFKLEDGQWQMLKPIAAPADSALIKNWLASVDETSTRSYPVEGLDLKQFGLKPPKLTLTLNNQKLEFGSSDPLDHQRYIRRGDTVYLANDMLFYQLQGDPLSFVSKRLLPKGAKITALTLPNLKLTRAGNGDWRLTPSDPKVDSDQIQKLIDGWQHAQAFNVKSADTSKSTGKILVQLQGQQEPIHFRILNNDSVLALARPKLGIEYQLPANRRDDLLKLTPKNKKPTGQKKQ